MYTSGKMEKYTLLFHGWQTSNWTFTLCILVSTFCIKFQILEWPVTLHIGKSVLIYPFPCIFSIYAETEINLPHSYIFKDPSRVCSFEGQLSLLKDLLELPRAQRQMRYAFYPPWISYIFVAVRQIHTLG